jgi:hypothetical protein
MEGSESKRLQGSIGTGLVSWLLLLACPVAAEAQYVATTNEDGTISIAAYSGPGGAVRIPGTIGGQPVTRIGDQAFAERTDLTSVTIPNGVTEIGIGAFYGCAGLPSVTIPEGVREIGRAAFDGCANLTNFTVATLNPTYSSLDGVLFSHEKSTLILFPRGKAGDYVVPEGVATIAESAFCQPDKSPGRLRAGVIRGKAGR